MFYISLSIHSIAVFLPHLIDIQCELMDPNEINASNTSTFDFTNIISYYTVTFIVDSSVMLFYE